MYQPDLISYPNDNRKDPFTNQFYNPLVNLWFLQSIYEPLKNPKKITVHNPH